MANSNNQFYGPGSLSPDQEHLLMAALNSNNPNPQNDYKSNQDFENNNDGTFDPNQQFPIDGVNPAFFQGQPNGMNFSTFDNIEESPYVDFLDGDTSFDFDASLNNGDAMIGGLPGSSTSPEAYDHDNTEKRKSPEDDAEDPDGGGKRRESDDKTAKKPGRKPLTSEPTTKRKAQNRAAQRAFRERKEKHLHDLETKVAELEKVSDATSHENGLLKAQVQRLQTELREYRKRLSLNSSGVNHSLTGHNVSFLSGMGGGNNFQFDFPRFGGLPGAHMLSTGAMSAAKGLSNSPSSARSSVGNSIHVNSGIAQRQNSNGSVQSPRTQSTGVASPDSNVSSQEVRAGQQSQSNARSPPLYNGASTPVVDIGHVLSTNSNVNRERTGSSSAQSRVFQFNSGANSSTDSPSASSVSQYGGANSSCDTSPEPSYNSPMTGKADAPDGYVCHGNSEGEVTFCEKLNMACGNPRNPIPRAKSNAKLANPVVEHSTHVNDSSALDILTNQNGGQFDPTLFGDYRDPQAAIVGDGDFTGGFFDDAFNFGSYGSPFASFGGDGITPATSSKANPISEIEKIQDGVEDEVVPGEDPGKFLNCHKIWDKLAQRSDFKDGTIDIDNLCSELRAKARCSESGVVVDDQDVEAALKRLPAADRA
ncbi:PAP1-domain-containing protein [Pseudovirgaria hyperparasitica]|uniref:PAP1-domain-containing protein n=1 Tax=Pseudovirgaria hyperparasitica TaxID=470096 RepID=A0A6A6WBI1_9PEZI|nr:PAP1-domain-containing protein [Pseudovirgaria hyperparasitica]KAF2760208.1 PAP1-domain-containing protein [Pseudovirgaria hyperparasitica]